MRNIIPATIDLTVFDRKKSGGNYLNIFLIFKQGEIMIWGKTHKQKEKSKPSIGDTKIKFIWFPDVLPDGRWVWLEYVTVRWEYFIQNRPRWEIQGIVPLHTMKTN